MKLKPNDNDIDEDFDLLINLTNHEDIAENEDESTNILNFNETDK